MQDVDLVHTSPQKKGKFDFEKISERGPPLVPAEIRSGCSVIQIAWLPAPGVSSGESWGP